LTNLKAYGPDLVRQKNEVVQRKFKEHFTLHEPDVDRAAVRDKVQQAAKLGEIFDKKAAANRRYPSLDLPDARAYASQTTLP